ncbi:unnamed protein product [Euphydryas editha]|uniref:Uncharacterized protein n=1 Tax=Euphydryas editha TaxID=104508 RepID=A0AAU9TZE0_EUPED|nr:unnamed protein product [Euphydryas editha]
MILSVCDFICESKVSACRIVRDVSSAIAQKNNTEDGFLEYKVELIVHKLGYNHHSVSQAVFDFSKQAELIQDQTHLNELLLLLYSFSNNKPIIRSREPAQIILKPKENQSRHFYIVSQDTVYDSPSVITTTTADVHCDAEVSSGDPAQIIVKPRANKSRHFNLVSQDTVYYDSPSIITTIIAADVDCDAVYISNSSRITLKDFIQTYQINQKIW